MCGEISQMNLENFILFSEIALSLVIKNVRMMPKTKQMAATSAASSS